MHALHDVISCSYHLVMVYYLLLQRVLEFLDVLEFSRISGLESSQLSRRGIHAVMQYKFDHFSHIDVSGIRGSVCSAAARAWLDASHDSPVSGLFHGAALAQWHLDGSSVVEESRVCLSCLDHLAALPEQSLRRTVPDSQRHYRLSGLQLTGRFQTKIWQLVGRVSAVRSLPANYEYLPHRIAGEGRGIPLIPDLIDLTCLEIHALQHLQRLSLRYILFIQYIFLIERPHILIEAAESAGGGADLDMECHVGEPYHLQSLLEGLRRILRNHSAVGSYGQQLLFSLLVAAVSSLTLCLVCHSVSIRDQTFTLDYTCLPEFNLFLILLAAADSIVYVGLTFLYVTFQAYGQKLLMIAGSLTWYAVSQSHGYNIVLYRLFYIRRQGIPGHILHGTSFPVFQSFQDLLPVFLWNIIWILTSDRKLVNIADIPWAGLELRM